MFNTTITTTFSALPTAPGVVTMMSSIPLVSSWQYPIGFYDNTISQGTLINWGDSKATPPIPREKRLLQKKRKDQKARKQWERLIDIGRKAIIEAITDRLNGYNGVTLIITDYTLPTRPRDIPGTLLEPRCGKWREVGHSPITDILVTHCENCDRYHCSKCIKVGQFKPREVTPYVELHSCTQCTVD